METLLLALLIVAIPFLIACQRDHHSKWAILMVCFISIFLWPVWFIALVWCFTGNTAKRGSV